MFTGSASKPAPGFIWDRARSIWFTTDIRNAARLRRHADDTAKKEIYRKYINREPWSGRVPIPRGLRPLPFQKPAIKFALERNRSFWWNDMGTGKGPCSAMVINGLSTKAPLFVVYVCPPELTFNVENELNKWLVKKGGLRVEVFRLKVKTKTTNGKRRSWLIQPSFDWGNERIRVLVLPDTMLSKVERVTLRAAWGDHSRELALVVDEADRFKNGDSDRTKALFGYTVKGEGAVKGFADHFPRILYMTGTGMPNGCALELYPVLSHSAPETIDFKNYYDFAFRYCVAKKSPYGWKFTDIKNEEVFREKVYGKFLFRLKKDVLDLPERIESALVVAADMKPKLASLDRKLHKYSPEDLMKKVIHAKRGGKEGDEDDLHLMTYRRLLGREKVAPLLPYIKRVLETESILVGAMHTEVVDLLAKGLSKFNPIVIDGRVDKKIRHQLIEEFKKDKRHRPVIANQAAMRRGFTILKIRRVLNLEWDWVPGNNDQFADRAHRIGQTKDVYIQYALFRNSVDMGVLEAIFRKRKNNRRM